MTEANTKDLSLKREYVEYSEDFSIKEENTEDLRMKEENTEVKSNENMKDFGLKAEFTENTKDFILKVESMEDTKDLSPKMDTSANILNKEEMPIRFYKLNQGEDECAKGIERGDPAAFKKSQYLSTISSNSGILEHRNHNRK